MLRSAWPRYDEDEIRAATDVLRSGKVNYWTGTECRRFEEAYAAHCDAAYAISLANGTVALELALRAWDIGPGDDVIVTPRSFMASVACVVAVGARPVFADVDPDSQNLTAETIRAALTPRTRAVICVHLAGWPCDMDPIMALADAHGLVVIEDCAQAHGATYKGRPVGGLGHVAAFSFCQDKIISTAGEGGMLVTSDPVRFETAWAYKDHGKSRARVEATDHPPGFRWLHESFGTNWRMTELQAAIGRIQLDKLAGWVERRRENAAVLDAVLGDLEALRIPAPGREIGHARYRHYAFVRPERLRPGWNRDALLAEIGRRGAPIFTGSCGEIYREAAVVTAGLAPDRPLPTARQLGETSLALQVDPTLERPVLQEVGRIVRETLLEATLPAPASDIVAA